MPAYPGISSEAFRHPLDREAESALRSVPGFDLVASKFVEFVYERPQLIYLMGNSIQAGPRQYGSVYQIFREAVQTLDIQPEPELFISQNPIANSYSMGKERPYIVVDTGLLSLLNDDELRVVLIHELGHLKCGHSILTQMALWVMNAASVLSEMTFGLGNLVSNGLVYAFYEWRRKAELSADRAALIGTDDLTLVLRTMMKLAGGRGGREGNECSLDEFIAQARRYEDLDQDGLNQIYKFMLYNGSQGSILSHPFPVERVKFLQDWAVSEEYQRIRSGNYPRSGGIDAEVVEEPEVTESEADRLRREVEELQEQIRRLRR
jgi:Zn-dependent protease with chaperone function